MSNYASVFGMNWSFQIISKIYTPPILEGYIFSMDVQKSIFLKSGSMVTGLTKAFLGVGDNQKELSFSDHTHNLPDLNGILTADKGGTGVSSLDELKTALGVSTNDYTMRFQVADYWQYSKYRIRVPMNVFGGIWFNDGISMLIRLRTPNQSRYYCYNVSPDRTSSTEINDLSTVGNDYILNGIYGVFWYPA